MLKISTIADFFMESLTENNKNIKVYVQKVYVIITKKIACCAFLTFLTYNLNIDL